MHMHILVLVRQYRMLDVPLQVSTRKGFLSITLPQSYYALTYLSVCCKMHTMSKAPGTDTAIKMTYILLLFKEKREKSIQNSVQKNITKETFKKIHR